MRVCQPRARLSLCTTLSRLPCVQMNVSRQEEEVLFTGKQGKFNGSSHLIHVDTEAVTGSNIYGPSHYQVYIHIDSLS